MTLTHPDLAEFLRLIVITDEEMAARHRTGERRGVEVVVEEALAAGCRAIQLRMKGARAREMLAAAERLRPMTSEASALLFVNDRLDVALAAGADGVHLGPDDIPVAAAREAIRRACRNRGIPPISSGRTRTRNREDPIQSSEPPSRPTGADRRFLIGYSTDDPGEARRAVADGADYIGCGTVYPTGSKDDTGSVIGLEGLNSVAGAVRAPVVGIGGITPERAFAVAETRASGAAVISAVMAAEDPGGAARTLLEPFGAHRSESHSS